MKIDFDWVELKQLDGDVLKKYCHSDEEVEFCWWVSGDLLGDGYDAVMKIIDDVTSGRTSCEQYRGNIHWVTFSQNGVKIDNPLRGMTFNYSLIDIESSLKKWHEKRLHTTK